MISGVGPTIEDLKARGIGILNGVTMGLPVNREQKRRYLKKHKSDKDASYCIYCKGNTLTLSDDYGDLVCELCGIVKDENKIKVIIGGDNNE